MHAVRIRINVAKQGGTNIFILEQLSSTKEQVRSFLSAEGLSQVEQVDDSREEGPAFSWTDVGFVEDASLLDDGAFVVVVGA